MTNRKINKKIKLKILNKIIQNRKKEILYFFHHIEKYHSLIKLKVAISYIESQIFSFQEGNTFAFYGGVQRWISDCYEIQFGINRRVERINRKQYLSDKLLVRDFLKTGNKDGH